MRGSTVFVTRGSRPHDGMLLLASFRGPATRRELRDLSPSTFESPCEVFQRAVLYGWVTRDAKADTWEITDKGRLMLNLVTVTRPVTIDDEEDDGL